MSSKKTVPQRLPTQAGPAEQPQPPREVVRELTPGLAQAVHALAREREQVVAEGNRRLAEINKSLLELARELAFPSGVPLSAAEQAGAGEGEGAFDFEQREGGKIVVVKVGDRQG